MTNESHPGGDVRKAGLARAASMTPAQRKALSAKAIKARWRKFYRENPEARKKRDARDRKRRKLAGNEGKAA